MKRNRYIKNKLIDFSNWRFRKLHTLNRYIQEKLYILEARGVASDVSCDMQEVEMVLAVLMKDYIDRHPEKYYPNIKDGQRWLVASSDDYRLHRNPNRKYMALKESLYYGTRKQPRD